MKWLFIFTAFAVFACSGLDNEDKNHNGKKTAPKKINVSMSSVALLELFTSEGCSSCPPADRLLSQLANFDSNVIPLSFHVDYWNQLGWTDPFSKAQFSERQKEYGEHFHLESIYTPQLIVNGEYELVGSNRSTAEADIKKAIGEKCLVRINIDEVRKDGNKLLLNCTLEGDWKQTNVAVALVQKHAEVKIKGGENGGSKLSHVNVVRSFVEKPAQQKISVDIEVPADVAVNNSQLIVYTQQHDLKITGAAIYSL